MTRTTAPAPTPAPRTVVPAPPPPNGGRAPRAHVQPRADSSDRSALGKCERRVLVTLHNVQPSNAASAISKVDLAVACGYTHSGGGFDNALGRLRSEGYLDELSLTARGQMHAETLEDTWAAWGEWMDKLGKAERAAMTALREHGALTTKQIADKTGYAADGGGFVNSLGHLRSLGLILGGLRGTPTALNPAVFW